MRLAEDHDSWKAGGIIRRDFRHTHNGPEFNPHGARKKKPPKKRSDHKHEYVVPVGIPYTAWYLVIRAGKKHTVTYRKFECIGCDKKKTVTEYIEQ